MKLDLPLKREPKDPADLERGFSLGSWRGHVQHACLYCPFDTLEGEGEIRDHIFQVHVVRENMKRQAAQPKTSRPITATLFDGSGKQIEEVPLPPAVEGEEDAEG